MLSITKRSCVSAAVLLLLTAISSAKVTEEFLEMVKSKATTWKPYDYKNLRFQD